MLPSGSYSWVGNEVSNNEVIVLGLPYVYFTVFTVSVFLTPPGRTPFTDLAPVNDHFVILTLSD
jgi:hypothetical protein